MPLLWFQVAQVEFTKLAHALPEFLGNLSIISMNECDGCNDYFGKRCDDHLSKVTMLPRTLTGFPRKNGPKSTFKSKDESLRTDAGGHKVDIRVPQSHSVVICSLKENYQTTCRYGATPGRKPTYRFRRRWPWSRSPAPCAQKKSSQCQGAIDWVRRRRQQQFSSFPVSFAFTPGVFDEWV